MKSNILVTELHYETLLVDGVETKVETSRNLYNDGELSNKYVYAYDEIGHMLSEIHIYKDSYEDVTDYFYEGDRLIQEDQTKTYFDEEKSPSHDTYLYVSFDEHGNWTEKVKSDDGKVVPQMYKEYTYDEYGDVIKEVRTTIWADLQSIQTTEYERFVVSAGMAENFV